MTSKTLTTNHIARVVVSNAILDYNKLYREYDKMRSNELVKWGNLQVTAREAATYATEIAAALTRVQEDIKAEIERCGNVDEALERVAVDMLRLYDFLGTTFPHRTRQVEGGLVPDNTVNVAMSIMTALNEKVKGKK